MIVELLLTPIFWIIQGLLAFIPQGSTMPGWLQDTLNLLSTAFLFFPPDVWLIVFGNICGWQFGLFGWSIIEWVYKKIPGVS